MQRDGDDYEVVIVGAGPAGLAAGVYCARKMLRTLVVCRDVGGQAALSWGVENYLGYQLISGAELVDHFREHVKSFDVDLREKVEVTALVREEGGLAVATDEGKFHAGAVIIASGKVPRELGIPGEQEFRGRGVTYCAICDGPLFARKDVAVVGAGNAGLDAAIQLSQVAVKVYLINAAPSCTGDEARRKKVRETENVIIMQNTRVTGIRGDRFVNSVMVEGIKDGKREEIAVSGVFVEIGHVPSTSFLEGFLELNATGEIVIDSSNHTSVPGVFAAGDVTDVFGKQIIIAAGEGAKAALAAHSYLISKEVRT